MAVHYIENIDGASLQDLAKEFGTPLYLYSKATIHDRYNSLDSALQNTRHKICYAVKASSNLSILKEFKELGAGFDIVSGGELMRVLTAGGRGEDIVFSGVGKTKDELMSAVLNDVGSINVESASELMVVQQVAATLNKKANVSFRVNPDIAIDSHQHLITGLKTTKFGVTLEEAQAMWESVKNASEINLIGIACHIGSGIYDLEPLKNAYTAMIDAATKLTQNGANLKRIDLGGGFGIGYSGHHDALNISQFGRMVEELSKNCPYEFVFEPGKYLIGEAGYLLSEVLYIKENDTKKFVILDAGMNDLMRPALYDAYHRIDVVGSKDSYKNKPISTYDIVGPVCESACFFAKDRALPKLNEGDLLLVRDAGAYGFSMSSRYNSRKLPPEVMIDSAGSKLIRRREEYEDHWSHEI